MVPDLVALGNVHMFVSPYKTLVDISQPSTFHKNKLSGEHIYLGGLSILVAPGTAQRTDTLPTQQYKCVGHGMKQLTEELRTLGTAHPWLFSELKRRFNV